MSKKSVSVYTFDMLVHVECENDIPFRSMQELLEWVRGDINAIALRVGIASSSVEKVIVQKKVTY